MEAHAHKGIKNKLVDVDFLQHWLGDILKQHYPKVKVPVLTKRERERMHQPTPFQRQAKKAVRVTMSDLLKPVWIRDFSFSPLGDGDLPKKLQRFARVEAERFKGAGCTPEFWYTEGDKTK